MNIQYFFCSLFGASRAGESDVQELGSQPVTRWHFAMISHFHSCCIRELIDA